MLEHLPGDRSSIETAKSSLVLHSLPPLPTVQGLGSALLHGTEFSYQYISANSAMGGAAEETSAPSGFNSEETSLPQPH